MMCNAFSDGQREPFTWGMSNLVGLLIGYEHLRCWEPGEDILHSIIRMSKYCALGNCTYKSRNNLNIAICQKTEGAIWRYSRKARKPGGTATRILGDFP